MTLKMICPDDTQPPPKDVWLVLSCDNHDGRTQRAVTFKQYGYIAQRKAAHKAGWKFLPTGEVYGPCCSGKVVEEDE